MRISIYGGNCPEFSAGVAEGKESPDNWALPTAQLLFGSLRKKLATEVIEYYSVMEKNGIRPLAATWMDLEMFILNELSQRKKYMIPLICGIERKKDTNEFIYNIERD